MLISCVVYRDGRKLADIDVSEIHEYLHEPGCFVWVALLEPNAAALAQMQEEFDLHPLAVEDARNGHQRAKIEEYGDSLFVALHIIEEQEQGELHIGEVNVFTGRNYVLSVRSRTQRGFQDVRARAEREPELLSKGAGYVLYALMDSVVDRYFPLLDKLEGELEAIEERLFADASPRANIESLYALKQKLMVIRHAVAPLAEGVSNLSGSRVPSICAGMREYFRDIYDHLQRLNETIESERDSVATAISVNLSMIQLQENDTMKRLAAYAALIAVPTLIAGIYGMNFDQMPELRVHYGYFLSLALMAISDGYVFYVLRKARWL
jgi:magnesium transporter